MSQYHSLKRPRPPPLKAQPSPVKPRPDPIIITHEERRAVTEKPEVKKEREPNPFVRDVIKPLAAEYGIQFSIITALISVILYQMRPRSVVNRSQTGISLIRLILVSVGLGVAGTMVWELIRWAYVEFMQESE